RHAGHRSEPVIRVQRQCPIDPPVPVPIGRPDGHDLGDTIGAVSTVGRPPRVVIPRWIQLVALPLLLVLAWLWLSATIHVVFLFMVAGPIGLLLDLRLRSLQRAPGPV